MTLSARELSLLSNTDVLGYIQAQNAKRDAQAKAEGWEFWTNMAEDIASEFANVYELELSFARGTYADVYKDWCGLKGYVSDHLTLEQVEAEIAEISEWVAEDAANQLADEIREEYWMDCEAREEEMRMLQMQRDAEEAEDVLWMIQDELSGVRAGA
jgi:hypothetical protein